MAVFGIDVLWNMLCVLVSILWHVCHCPRASPVATDFTQYPRVVAMRLHYISTVERILFQHSTIARVGARELFRSRSSAVATLVAIVDWSRGDSWCYFGGDSLAAALVFRLELSCGTYGRTSSKRAKSETPHQSDFVFSLLYCTQLLGTLFQPILILYFVYWFWNRFDISLDAIIKFFASGFVIATSTAMVYEMLVSALTTIAVSVAALFGVLALALAGDLTISLDDDTPVLSVPSKFRITIALLAAFLNSFVVAALVEELAKYLCFLMVEHPDFPDESSETASDDAEEALLPEQSQGVSRESRKVSFVSRGAAITIAMVTTALGFACAENLLYVFVYAPPGVATEVSTLLARSLFPVHPLAAALQSIGVCRRDLERDSSTGVGRILLPALLLHGTFDFVLMAAQVWSQVYERYEDQGDDGTNNQAGSEVIPNASADTAEDLTDALPELIASVTILLVGIAYYVIQARSQRIRLKALDQEHRQ
jgi:RsiW-degrading membrane proteinase PrsW (M82 family)